MGTKTLATVRSDRPTQSATPGFSANGDGYVAPSCLMMNVAKVGINSSTTRAIELNPAM